MTETVKHTPGPWNMSEETVRDGLRSRLIHGMPEGMLAIVRVEHQGRYYGDANARLIAAAPEAVEVLHEGRRAIGDHYAPSDCYATGPVTGDSYRDLVQCPACSFIRMYDAVMKKIGGEA